MRFTLLKKTGARGTEIKISVLLSTEEVDGIKSINDDPNISLDNLRISGDDYLKSDHALMVLRVLVHQVDLLEAARTNPVIRGYLTHGVMRKKLVMKNSRKRKRGKK